MFKTSGIQYPYPELVINNITASGGTNVYITTAYDSAGDSAALADFVIKINGVSATLLTWADGGDSTITIGISETITTGQTVTMTYVPNSARWVEAPFAVPAYVLFAMDDEPVTNNN